MGAIPRVTSARRRSKGMLLFSIPLGQLLSLGIFKLLSGGMTR